MLQKIKDLISESEARKDEIYDQLGYDGYKKSEEVKFLCERIRAYNEVYRIAMDELKSLETVIREMRTVKY